MTRPKDEMRQEYKYWLYSYMQILERNLLVALVLSGVYMLQILSLGNME